MYDKTDVFIEGVGAYTVQQRRVDAGGYSVYAVVSTLHSM